MSKVIQFPTKAGLNYPSKPMTTSLVPLSGGRAGVVQTLTAMRGYVNKFRVNPEINAFAVRLVNQLPQKDYKGEINALFNYVKNSIRYTRDVNNVETVRDPEITLKMKAGDCDDKATLLATLLETIGFKTRFHAMGRATGSICHVIVEVQNPTNGLWIPLETTADVLAGWMPSDIAQSVYYYEGGRTETINGLFSSIRKSVKKVASGAGKLVKSTAKKSLNVTKSLSKGDIKGAASAEWAGTKEQLSTANQLRKDIHAAIVPKIVRDAEGKLSDATIKALSSKAGGIVLSILSVIPVTAPFALGAQAALIVAQAENVRKAMNAMDKAKRKDTTDILETVRFVYDPAISAIRERQPRGDESLVEFKYVDGKLVKLNGDENMNAQAQLTPAQKKILVDNTVKAVAAQYPDYAVELRRQLTTEGLGLYDTGMGDLGFGWGEAFGQIASQVAGQYASGKIASKFAKDQMKDQLKLMNAQLKTQTQTPPVQGQRQAISNAIDQLSAFTSENKVAIIGAVTVIGLLIYLATRKK